MIISRLYRRLHARPSTQPQKKTASTTTQQGGAKGTATMALHLFRYDLRAFFRTRQARFFTLALPALFLVIFASIFGGSRRTVSVAGGQIDTSVYHVPGIIALGNHRPGDHRRRLREPRSHGHRPTRDRSPETAQGHSCACRRGHHRPGPHRGSRRPGNHRSAPGDRLGRLRRPHSCPDRPRPHRHGRRGHSRLLLPWLRACIPDPQRRRSPTHHPSRDTPPYFISGVFVAVTVLPSWLVNVANVFPVRHLADALLVAYNPHTSGSGFAAGDLLVVAAWEVAGLLIAVRRFSWLPLAH
jgi:ABC-2 type transport system permease protein